MIYFFLCAFVFLAAYTLNILYVTVFYHRALAHRSVTLHPLLETFVIHSGNWVTGLDPKGWVCMHRLHHRYSDTPKDPHSPVKKGIWKVLPLQLYSYKKTILGLLRRKSEYISLVQDLDFPVSFLNRTRLWYLPYLLHLVIAIVIALAFHAWILAACYWIGMMSHPLQGWMVNALAHRFGYINFKTSDNSRNNTVVAWLVFGDGYQNNHHHNPGLAKFSVKPMEFDLGFGLCLILSHLGILKVHSRCL